MSHPRITITKDLLPLGGDRLSLTLKSWTYPAGEVGVRLDAANHAYLRTEAPHQTISARLQSSADVMELLMVTDALRRIDSTPVRLFCPYLPYARQDRVCCAGESHSLRVFADLINGLAFERVTVVDPHSEVTSAVLNRLHVITQQQVIGAFDLLTTRLLTEGTHFRLISPDAGAAKKTAALATYFGHADYVRCDKVRDLATGDIVETKVYADDLTGLDCVIVDDLCEGGRTFIELVKVLRAKGAAKIVLFTTHGLYSKGTRVLLDNGINELYSTDSYYPAWPTNMSDITTLRLDDAFRL